VTKEDEIKLTFQLQFIGLYGFVNEDGTLDRENPDFQKYFAAIVAAIRYAYDCCDFNREAVDILAMSHPDHLGATIYDWQDKAGVRRSYTGNTGYVVTVAKTVPHRTEDGRVQSSIVMNAIFLGALVDVIAAETPIEDWEVEKQECLYLVAHEFGHAHDNALRLHLGENEIDLENEDDWVVISQHCAGVLTGEFLVCFYSSPVVTEKLQRNLIDRWHSPAEEVVRSVLNAKLNLLANVSLFAAHNLWFMIIEYAKLVGHNCGNSSLPRPALWKDADSDEQDVFKSIEEFLIMHLAPNSGSEGQAHISQVPESNLEQFVFANLYPVWQKLCRSYGIYLKDEPDEESTDSAT